MMLKPLLSLCLLLASVQAHALFLSTTSSAVLGGLSFRSGDIVEYNPATSQARLVWAGSFVDTENIDGLQALPGSRFIISTGTDAQLVSGLAFRDGDLVLIDPVTGVGSLFFSEDRFGGTDEDIDAVEILPSGRLLLSTTSGATLGGLTFRSGDVIEYDPVAGTAVLVFNADVFADTESIDALALLDGDLILSTATDAIIGSTMYRDGDLFRYNLVTGAHSLFLSEAIFGDTDKDIDAVAFAVPVPGSMLLLISGLIVVAWCRHEKHRACRWSRRVSQITTLSEARG